MANEGLLLMNEDESESTAWTTLNVTSHTDIMQPNDASLIASIALLMGTFCCSENKSKLIIIEMWSIELDTQSTTTENGNWPQFDGFATTEEPYDPASFYHTPVPKPGRPTEKILTFCTKDVAIRDSHNFVIACGSETEIWEPTRCPAGSECFIASDSTFRICCPVGQSIRRT